MSTATITVKWPIVEGATTAQDVNLICDLMQQVIRRKSSLVGSGMLEPLTEERLLLAVRFIGEVGVALLDADDERKRTERESEQLTATD